MAPRSMDGSIHVFTTGGTTGGTTGWSTRPCVEPRRSVDSTIPRYELMRSPAAEGDITVAVTKKLTGNQSSSTTPRTNNPLRAMMATRRSTGISVTDPRLPFVPPCPVPPALSPVRLTGYNRS